MALLNAAIANQTEKRVHFEVVGDCDVSVTLPPDQVVAGLVVREQTVTISSPQFTPGQCSAP